MATDAVEPVDCPVCGPAPSRVWQADGLTRYLRCRRCGTVYASPRASQAARRAALLEAYADGDFARQNACARRPVLGAEAALLQQYVPSGTLLDVGCDLGDLFAYFPRPTWRLAGVELSPSAASAAASAYGADVRAGDLRTAAFDAASADLVTMLDMFYYLGDPRRELAEAARVLKPAGVLAIEVPGLRWMLARSRGLLCLVLEGKWRRLRSDSAYLNWYSPGALRRLVEEAGFTVLGFHVVGSPAGPGIVRRVATELHAGASAWAVRLSPGCLTWAPKYLMVARRSPPGPVATEAARVEER